MSDSEENSGSDIQSGSEEASEQDSESEGSDGEASDAPEVGVAPAQLAVSVARVFATGEAMRHTLTAISDALRMFEPPSFSSTRVSAPALPPTRSTEESRPAFALDNPLHASSSAQILPSHTVVQRDAASGRTCGSCGRSKGRVRFHKDDFRGYVDAALQTRFWNETNLENG